MSCNPIYPAELRMNTLAFDGKNFSNYIFLCLISSKSNIRQTVLWLWKCQHPTWWWGSCFTPIPAALHLCQLLCIDWILLDILLLVRLRWIQKFSMSLSLSLPYSLFSLCNSPSLLFNISLLLFAKIPFNVVLGQNRLTWSETRIPTISIYLWSIEGIWI